jgi:hypothetical protein
MRQSTTMPSSIAEAVAKGWTQRVCETCRGTGMRPGSVIGYPCAANQCPRCDAQGHAARAAARASATNLRSPRALSQLLNLLRAVTVDAPAALCALQESLPRIAYGTEQPASLWSSSHRLVSARDVVHSAIGAARLSAAKAEIKRISDLFTDESGKLGVLAREFLRDAVGQRHIESAGVERAWDAVRATLDDLAQHGPQFEILRALSERLETAGASHWAKRYPS